MTIESLLQLGWTVTAAALVLFMQAGFCALEAGTVRTKNSINVAIKNIMDMCCSITAYFVIGYALMFGANADGWGLVGSPALFLAGVDNDGMLSFLFQLTFCATAATIVSGAIAERCRFLPYILMALFLGTIIYPMFGHWVWGGGWLSQLGFHDFAGSAVVHGIGGAVGLAGIMVLGARHGRFEEGGRVRNFPASSMPMVAIGVIILTVGWIGFNGGSAPLGPDTATIIVNTLLAACFGGLVALLVTWAFGGLAAVELILNGVLGGLVAITAGADVVSPTAAMAIGIVGGISVVLFTRLLERMRLDDVVGAVPVHLGAGLVGVLATAIFCIPEAVPEGLSRWGFLGVQAIGAGACLLWGLLTGLLMWWIIGRITPLRTGPHEEQVGLNFSEHRVRDPFADLAVALAKAGRGEDAQAELQGLQDSEAAAFGLALGAVLTRRHRDEGEAQALAVKIERIASDLSGQMGSSGERNALANRFADLSDFINRIQAYLEDHRHESTAVPLLIDLLQRLQEQLVECQHMLPHDRDGLLSQTVQRLGELSRGLRHPQVASA